MKGYLYKQGEYFGAWNDRFFVLEGSLLKQFTSEETVIPSCTVFLGMLWCVCVQMGV